MPTSAIAQTFSDEIEVESHRVEDKKILKGMRAEFDGVLVPEKNYRFYQARVDQHPLLLEEIQKTQNDASELQMTDKILFFGFGLALGVVASYMITKEFRAPLAAVSF